MAERYRGRPAAGRPGRPDGSPTGRGATRRRLPGADGRIRARGRAPRRRSALIDAANEYIASTEPWALARDPARADALTQVLFDVAEADADRGRAAAADHARSAAEILRRVGETTPAEQLRIADAEWRTSGERVIAQRRRAVAARREQRETNRAGRQAGRRPTGPSTRSRGAHRWTTPISRRRRCADDRPAAPAWRGAPAAPAPPRRAGRRGVEDLHRRFHEGRSARRQGADRREGARTRASW